MKEYIVSARKYRPMSFDTVVGQRALTTTLKNAVKSGKLAHAYLFCGPRGVGKTTCARIFAKAINCMNPTSKGEACNECESCSAFNEQRSYNIFELDAASNNSVENIKALMEQTRIPPQVGKYKVFIIDEVHMLSTQAFNAFLKTLEEPPAHVIFILATTEKHKVLPTIISRCQIYDFERMSVSDIVNHLKSVAEKEGVTCEDEALALIAEKADGGMRDALSIFDQAVSFCQGDITSRKVAEDLNMLDTDNYFRIVDLAVDNKVADIMLLVNDIISRGFDGGNLINGLAAHVRNVMIAKDEQTLSLLEASGKKAEQYKEQAKKCSAKFLFKALKLMNDCDVNYRQSNNKRLLVELTLIEIAQITQDDESPGSGLGPKRLKSLFNKIAASAQPKTAGQVAVAADATTARESVSTYDTASKPEQHQVTAEPENRQRRASVAMSSLTTSFSNMLGNGRKPSTTAPAGRKAATAAADTYFDETELQKQWTAICNLMPARLRAMAARMRSLKPVITTFPAVEVTVDSSTLLDDMQKMKDTLRSKLAGGLGNASVTLSIKLAEVGSMARIMSKKELVESITEKNAAAKRLFDELDMEID